MTRPSESGGGYAPVIAAAWAEQAGPGSSWFDLIEGHAHNIPHWAINQRELEKFVAFAVAQR